MKVNKGHWFSMTCYLVIVCIAIMGLLTFTGCSGGGDGGGHGGGDGDVSGTGTLRDPYIFETEKTYNVEVKGWQDRCGDNWDFNCADFDEDYVSTKVSVPTAEIYKLSITGVEQDRDLVVFVWKAVSHGSPNIEYVATLDNAGNGGSEEYTGELEATDYWLFLQSNGGLDTVQGIVAKQ